MGGTSQTDPATNGGSGWNRVRGLLVLVAILLGVVFGQVGGILAVVNGATIAAAFVTGGITFAGTTTFVLAIQRSLGVL